MHNWWVKFNQQTRLDKISQLLIFAIVLSLPINLFYKFSLEGAYVRGLLVDYLIPKIYLHQILILLLLLLHWPRKLWPQLKQLLTTKKALLASILLGALITRQFFTANPSAALSYLLSLSLGSLFFASMTRLQAKQSATYKSAALVGMMAAVVMQSLLAIAQFIKQASIFPYQILGESNLHNLTSITKGQFGDIEKILPYASTAHPNILAGFIAIFSILIIENCVKKRSWLVGALIANALLIIYLTQSWSALATLLLYGLWRLRPNLLTLIGCYALIICGTPLLINHFAANTNQPSLLRRAHLNQAAWQMWLQQPLQGVGLNQFTNSLEKNATSPEIVRFVQPAHHSLLLVLSEGGLLLILALIYLVRKDREYQALRHGLILLAILSLDHYLLTQSAGWNLLLIFYWLIKE